ncbi:MAG: hypothetical protein D6818_09000, partial [Bacteroidetes bacterium]
QYVSLSANEARQSDLRLYVADSALVIEWHHAVGADPLWIEYSDMKGSIAFRQTLPTGALTTAEGRLALPLPDLPKGAYVIALQSKEGVRAIARLFIP